MPRPYKPTSQECAVLLVLLAQAKGADAGKDMTRLRVAEITLRRLWLRNRWTDEFLREVADWLLDAGWALFYAKSTFALVSTKAVEGWPRISSKRFERELARVREGEFNFDRHLDLLTSEDEDRDED